MNGAERQRENRVAKADEGCWRGAEEGPAENGSRGSCRRRGLSRGPLRGGRCQVAPGGWSGGVWLVPAGREEEGLSTPTEAEARGVEEGGDRHLWSGGPHSTPLPNSPHGSRRLLRRSATTWDLRLAGARAGEEDAAQGPHTPASARVAHGLASCKGAWEMSLFE